MTTNPDVSADVHPVTSASDSTVDVVQLARRHPWWTAVASLPVVALVGYTAYGVAAKVLQLRADVLHHWPQGWAAFVGPLVGRHQVVIAGIIAVCACVALLLSMIPVVCRPAWRNWRSAEATVAAIGLVPLGLVIRSTLMHSPALVPLPSRSWVEHWFRALPQDRQLVVMLAAAVVGVWAARRLLIVALLAGALVVGILGVLLRIHFDHLRERPVESSASPPELTVVETTVTESPPEEMFWQAYQAAPERYPDLAGLVPQHKVAGGKYRLDFAVPDRRVDIEIDGLAFHNQAAFANDHRRQRYLEDHRWRVRRFAAVEVTANAERCVRDADAFARQVAPKRHRWPFRRPPANEEVTA